MGLLAGAARGADDHEQPARTGATRQWLRRHAELLREPDGHAFATRREVHRGLRIGKARSPADLLDRVTESADVARAPPRVVDVAAAVQHGHRNAPWGGEDGVVDGRGRMSAARAGDDE